MGIEDSLEQQRETTPPVRTNFTSKPVSPLNTSIPPMSQKRTSSIDDVKSDEEEDLEIPAFIRKKMGM